MSGGKDRQEKPETALEEVFQEVGDAGKRNADGGDGDGGSGEAADAITPNTDAQEESRGD